MAKTILLTHIFLLFSFAAYAQTGLEISDITDNLSTYPGSQLPRYEKLEITFHVDNTVASNLQMPYDAGPPAGITPGIGITVNAEFSQDNFQTIYIQPAFYYQEFEEDPAQPFKVPQKSGRDWIYPTENYSWKVRFAPHKEGPWQYRLTSQDSSVPITPVISQANTFTVAVSANKGFVRVSSKDPRYFEFEDGTYFAGLGYNMNYNQVNWQDPVLDNEPNFQKMSQNGIEFIRIWLSEWGLYTSAWTRWRSIQLGGYLSPAGTEYVEVYPGSEVSMKVSASWNRCMMISDWNDAAPAVKRNTNYRVQIRYKTGDIDLATVIDSSKPYGFVAKTGGWLWDDTDETKNCYYPGTGTVVTSYQSQNTSDWQILTGTINSGNSDFLPFFYLVMENLNMGRAYVDYVWIQEDLGGGQYGPNIVSKPWMANHLYFEQRGSYAFDKVLDLANKYNIYLRPVVLEKNEEVMNRIDYNGNFVTTPSNNYFYGNWRNMSKVRWLQQAWWRYLQARWGYSVNIHSWEALNEGDPFSGLHYTFADEFGKYMKQFAPDNHLVSTSNWGSYPNLNMWGNSSYPNIDFTDVHFYQRENQAQTLRVDVPRAGGGYDLYYAPVYDTTDAYDLATSNQKLGSVVGTNQQYGVGKPLVRGEVGFFRQGGDDPNLFAGDNQGIWLHKWIWGLINPTGLYDASYWYPNFHIYRTWEDTVLYPVCNSVPVRIDDQGRPVYRCSFDYRNIFGRYHSFIKDIPLSNGHYQDVAVTSSTNPNIRAWGQKDPVNGRAHLWIDNKRHTWKNVVDGVALAPESGTVTFSGMPEGDYTATWYDTYSNPLKIIKPENLIVDSSGAITLDVLDLTTDTAVKIEPVPAAQIPGDVDNNGSVNVLDIQACVNYILSASAFDPGFDVNGDNSVDVLDVQNIVNIILGV